MSNNAPEFVITMRDDGDIRARTASIDRLNIVTAGGRLSAQVTLTIDEPDDDTLAAILGKMKKTGLWAFELGEG